MCVCDHGIRTHLPHTCALNVVYMHMCIYTWLLCPQIVVFIFLLWPNIVSRWPCIGVLTKTYTHIISTPHTHYKYVRTHTIHIICEYRDYIDIHSSKREKKKQKQSAYPFFFIPIYVCSFDAYKYIFIYIRVYVIVITNVFNRLGEHIHSN